MCDLGSRYWTLSTSLRISSAARRASFHSELEYIQLGSLPVCFSESGHQRPHSRYQPLYTDRNPILPFTDFSTPSELLVDSISVVSFILWTSLNHFSLSEMREPNWLPEASHRNVTDTGRLPARMSLLLLPLRSSLRLPQSGHLLFS